METREMIKEFFEKTNGKIPEWGEPEYEHWRTLCEIVAENESISLEGRGREKWLKINQYIDGVRKEEERKKFEKWLKTKDEEL